jgi:hypothetical protein
MESWHFNTNNLKKTQTSQIKYKNGHSQGHWDPLDGALIDSLTCIWALQFKKNDSLFRNIAHYQQVVIQFATDPRSLILRYFSSNIAFTMKYQPQNHKNDHVNKDYTLKQHNKGTPCEPLKSALKALNIYGKHDISTQTIKKTNSNQPNKIQKWPQPRGLGPPGRCINQLPHMHLSPTIQ